MIAKHNLKGPSDEEAETVERMTVVAGNPLGLREHLGTILVLAICVGLGNLVNQLIFAKGVLLPGFLTSLLVGVLLTNLADLLKMKLSMTPIDAAGEVSLNIFLSMSMMSMQLWTLAGALGPIMLVLIVQMLVMTVFAVFIVFNLMGRDYDASAIAWGGVAEEAGLAGAAEIGIAFATFGLIAGGLIGGPIAGRLIAKHNLRGPSDEEAETVERMTVVAGNPLGLREHLGTILVLAICVGLGNLVNQLIFAKGVLLPGFLTSLLVGVLLTNLADLLKMKLSMTPIDAAGEVSLNIFLSMSMMSMQLWTLAGALGPIMLVLIVQMLVMTVFAVFIVFNLMGRDYDACVITSGFAGLGLGATPVAIANMTAVTARFGPSPKAFLVVPLVGAFFIDLLNASVIKFFIAVITRFLT